MVHSMCVRVFVHVGHAKVIVSARAPLYMMCGYVTGVGRVSPYKVSEARPLSQCVYVMGRERSILLSF